MTSTESGTDATIVRSFRAHPSALYEIRHFVSGLARQAGLTERNLGDLLVAVSEACSNSIIHTSSRDVRLTWHRFDDSVQVEIRDEGVFRRRVRMPELEGPAGHGFPLMMALADEVTVREGTEARPGTIVRLTKRLHEDEAGERLSEGR